MSVKTGAVGSNPKIDKLMNADSDSLRKFAGTTMLNQILQTKVTGVCNAKPDQTDTSTTQESRDAMKRSQISEITRVPNL